MAAGHSLQNGLYEGRPLSDDEMWSAFAYVFSSKSVNDTSYKFGFLKSILDNLYNVDAELKLTFDQLFSTFAEIYWNLVLKHHILQKNPGKLNRQSALERVLTEAKEKFAIEDDIPFESISNEAKKYVYHKVKQNCKQNVVGALYADLQQLLYSFDKAGEWIQFNPQMYEFVCKRKVAIEKINYYEWAKFLEKVNEDSVVDHLLSKIDESTLHTRKSLMYYRDILFQEFENKCFYCGKPVSYGNVEVDHFIPWSFVKDDKLWNFVLSCPECNNQKRDKLANTVYLERIEERNKILIEQSELASRIHLGRVRQIYNYAKRNGYNDIWAPEKKCI